MSDEHDNTKPEPETTPKTSLHAYRDGREEDVKGGADALTSNDAERLKRIEADDELELAHKKV